jgi:uncharacterized cupin superfamily protein
MTATPTVSVSNTDAQTPWEPFVHDGHTVGEVHWLVQEARQDGVLAAGLWRIDPESGAEMPYAVSGSETIHVLEGEAVLELPDGTTIDLAPGVIVALPDGFTATWRTLSAFKKFFVVA